MSHIQIRRCPVSPRRLGGIGGFTLVELMVSLVIFAVISITLLHHLTISYSSTANARDRVFAYTKAQAILAEMHALVDASPNAAAIDLDEFDDGASYNPVLSTQRDRDNNPVPPDHPISGNRLTPDGWEWTRRITVRPFASVENRSVRYVTVRIFQSTGVGREVEVASLSSVINSSNSGFPTTQVYDVYLLAIENIPGWWVFMENIVPSVEAAITDLENRNPGLVMRTHWITKASYGRNQTYKPYINAAADSYQEVPFTYYYPGKMEATQSSNYYYVPSMMRARMNQDGTEVHGYDAALNPHPYALADFFNHAMRLPKEREFHDQRVARARARRIEIETAKANNTTPPPELDDMSEEPTLRLLLEDMNTDPDKYRHALIVNLHGELAPMPSIRNYSDPAKTPAYPGVRAVTHPEELRTQKGSSTLTTDDLFLRVYAYSADRQSYHGDPSSEPVVPFILVDVMDVDLRGPLSGPTPHHLFHDDGSVKAMQGGVTLAGGEKGYPTLSMTDPAFPDAKTYFDPTADTRSMRYLVTLETLPSGRKFSRITLANTPIRCDVVRGADNQDRGLFANDRSRLYGLEYVPSPTRGTDFTRDLAAPGDGPKNTARWRIRIPASLVAQSSRWYTPTGTPRGSVPEDVQLTIRTHIWDNSTTWPRQPGQLFPTWEAPENLSETYAWWSADRDAVPFTERAQFLGDPRFNPYRDLLHGDPDFGDGYNWFFAALDAQASSDFPGIERRFDRWGGQMRQDVPRFFEMLRNGLVESESLFTTLTGYSYYYMGHGNEIGYDSANGYPYSIPTNMKPFGDPAAGVWVVNNITEYRRYVREHNGGTDFWWGMPWLGELYPDTAEPGQWRQFGNLVAGNSAANQFYRARDSDCFNSTRYHPFGTTASSAIQRTQTMGCVSFMNNGTTDSHFNHHFDNAPAVLVGSGLDLRDEYNFPLPSSTPCNRPFSLGSGGNLPTEFNLPPYSTNRYVASLMQKYYDRGQLTGSGLILLENPGQTRGAHIVVTGLSETTTIGSSFIAKYSLLAMLQSYFESGAQGVAHRIPQTPRISISSPNELTELVNPTEVDFAWDVDWLRWDGQKYTSGTPADFAEDESQIEYSLMLSKDNGLNWTQLVGTPTGIDNTGVSASPGRRPANAAHITPDFGNGPELGKLQVPAASYPHARYMLRIEAYRKNQSLHYSQHVTRFFIDR